MIPFAETLGELLAFRARENAAKVVYRFLPDGERESHSLTFARLDLEVRALASRLAEKAAPGERALILAPDPADFVRAFLACQYADVIAVPIYPPMPFDKRRGTSNLRAIAQDCAPRTIIFAGPDGYERFIADSSPEIAALEWIRADEIDEGRAGFRPVPADPAGISFLQYTSGSTSSPKGVMVSHRALLAQERLLHEVGEFSTDSVIVSWLPLFHDMGLIGNVLLAVYAGCEAVLMPPLTFVQQPIRWLRAISTYRATVSGGPNFAYDLCVRRVPEQDRRGLDLSSLRIAFNGAEPVRAGTLEAFTAAYAPHGFDPGALYPCYGLAEVTLMATGSPVGGGPVTLDVHLDALQEGRLVTGGGHRVVGSGRPGPRRRLEIVDPETCLPVRPGHVGEIWVAGPDVTDGYWGRPDESAEVFGARLTDTFEGPFLRTGDLGVVHEGELFVSGRLKDLIIVGGRNHYPQDLEATTEQAHPLIRRGCVTAFGDAPLVVVAEVKPGADEEEFARIGPAVRAAVSAGHGVQVDDVVLIEAGTMPKTSSGKLQRRACRAAYESGALTPAAPALQLEGTP
ncbi:fatty acyl-AMP ligase [Nonomuraea sp. MG754425]|uniref:fatty acyl-AMP ligase n=1 Tax=Nonomuraea sp. MG754425 TaxID=2570319 RepID=UPI001F2D866F|nr:fatty acyl-AMP ligase [Nonomuraea sp. MG754425]